MRYYLVDVFTGRKYTGNALAVVHTPKPLPKARMQAIAAEFNLSETTFVIGEVSAEQGRSTRGLSRHTAKVRIFTPQSEVPFAGHPTLGTAHVIAQHLLPKPSKSRQATPTDIILNLQAGRIPVRFDARTDLWWLKAPQPTFGPVYPGKYRAMIAHMLSLEPSDIDSRYPVQEISTGIAFLMIPLRNLEAARKAAVDLQAYRRLFAAQGIERGRPLFLFCHETEYKNHQAHARMLAPVFGIPEDPATGSANACFGAYCLSHGYFKARSEGKAIAPVSFRVEQGLEMGRPSSLHVRAACEVDSGLSKSRAPYPAAPLWSLEVGGLVVDVAEGRLLT